MYFNHPDLHGVRSLFRQQEKGENAAVKGKKIPGLTYAPSEKMKNLAAFVCLCHPHITQFSSP
jgi:hypothetical protein